MSTFSGCPRVDVRLYSVALIEQLLTSKIVAFLVEALGILGETMPGFFLHEGNHNK